VRAQQPRLSPTARTSPAGAERERRAGGHAGLTARETLVAHEAISTGLRSDGLACYGILVCGASGELFAIRNSDRNVWTTANSRPASRTPWPPRVCAHVTGEWRQAALAELAARVAGVDA